MLWDMLGVMQVATSASLHQVSKATETAAD